MCFFNLNSPGLCKISWIGWYQHGKLTNLKTCFSLSLSLSLSLSQTHTLSVYLYIYCKMLNRNVEYFQSLIRRKINIFLGWNEIMLFMWFGRRTNDWLNNSICRDKLQTSTGIKPYLLEYIPYTKKHQLCAKGLINVFFGVFSCLSCWQYCDQFRHCKHLSWKG